MKKTFLVLILGLLTALTIGCSDSENSDTPAAPNNGGTPPGENKPAYELFAAKDGATGRELWRTDGTEAGTVFVKDINEKVVVPQKASVSAAGSSPYGFVWTNGKYYFFANDGVNGCELWVSDGTKDGTKMVKDFYTGLNSGITSDSKLYTAGGKLFLEVQTGVDANSKPVAGIYVSDGTSDGTKMIEGTESCSVADAVEMNGKVYLIYGDATGVFLGEFDGSAKLTKVSAASGITSPNWQSGAFSRYCVISDNKLYFINFTSASKEPSGNRDLWYYDGTNAAAVNTGLSSQVMVTEIIGAAKGNLIFSGNESIRDANGSMQTVESYYVTDCKGKSVKIEGLTVGSINPNGVAFDAANGKAYIASDAKIYRITGSTIDSFTCSANVDFLTLLNGKLYFTYLELNQMQTKADGTQAFNYLYRLDENVTTNCGVAVSESVRVSGGMHAFNGKILFAGVSKQYGTELFGYDGVSADSALVKNIYEDATGITNSSYPYISMQRM